MGLPWTTTSSSLGSHRASNSKNSALAKEIEQANRSKAILKKNTGLYPSSSLKFQAKTKEELGVDPFSGISYDQALANTMSTLTPVPGIHSTDHSSVVHAPQSASLVLFQTEKLNAKKKAYQEHSIEKKQNNTNKTTKTLAQQHMSSRIPSLPSRAGSTDSTVTGSLYSASPSISEVFDTMDVHKCPAKSCPVCAKYCSEKHGTKFVHAESLDDSMIKKLRSQPPRWFELGRSFVDLYQEANGTSRRRRTTERSSSSSSTLTKANIQPANKATVSSSSFRGKNQLSKQRWTFYPQDGKENTMTRHEDTSDESINGVRLVQSTSSMGKPTLRLVSSMGDEDAFLCL